MTYSIEDTFMYNFVEYKLFHYDDALIKLSASIIGDTLPSLLDSVMYNGSYYKVLYINTGKKIVTLRKVGE